MTMTAVAELHDVADLALELLGGLGHASSLSDYYLHRHRRRQRPEKHGSAWQTGSGPVSMLRRTTVLVGMTGGL